MLVIFTSQSTLASPIEITAKQLAREYQRNEARADKKYLDKELLITGMVDSIPDPLSIILSSGELFSFGIEAEINESELDKLLKLNKGDYISLLCIGDGSGEFMISAQLKSCEIKKSLTKSDFEKAKIELKEKEEKISSEKEEKEKIAPAELLKREGQVALEHILPSVVKKDTIQAHSYHSVPSRSYNYQLDLSKLNFQEGLAYYQGDKGLYGFMDRYSNVVISPRYKGAGSFYHNRAVVKDSRNELWGYIDKNANWIVKPQFCMAGRFSEGLAAVYIGGRVSGNECIGGKWGFIDTNGRVVIAAKYERVWAFTKVNGNILAKFEHAGYTGYINKKGEWVK